MPDGPAPRIAILTQSYAGLRAQAEGLAEAAGLSASYHAVGPRGVWRHVPASWWPNGMACATIVPTLPDVPDIAVGCGGKAAAVVAALRLRGTRTVAVQNPRMDIRRFDVVVVARHDRVTGPNVVVTRTALHRVTDERLAAAAAAWRLRLAALPRPLVAVLVGGSNRRLRLDRRIAEQMTAKLEIMIRNTGAGVILTTSRRTPPDVLPIFRRLESHGAWIWSGDGENPYFGMLALADLLVVTADSISMVSEAVATTAPVLVQELPGRSRRISVFLDGLRREDRIRSFEGRLDLWPVAPLNDTPEAGKEVRGRLGLE